MMFLTDLSFNGFFVDPFVFPRQFGLIFLISLSGEVLNNLPLLVRLRGKLVFAHPKQKFTNVANDFKIKFPYTLHIQNEIHH